MRDAFGQCSLWLARDRFKRVQIRVLPDGYELRFFAGNDCQGSVEITPEQYRAVLHDFFHFDENEVSLTYDSRHVIVRIKNERWGNVADVDLMKLENLALNGGVTSVDSTN